MHCISYTVYDIFHITYILAKLLLKSNKSKRKDRLALAISDLKPSSVSKSMAFTSNDANRRKRNSDGFQNSASKKQKVPLLDQKKSLFLEID